MTLWPILLPKQLHNRIRSNCRTKYFIQ